jgi:pimeloyl-ACP methyl ester carboxylesterase
MPPRTRPSIWSETRVAEEFAELVGSSIYRGRDVPRGDGRIVMVLPGMFGNDLYLEPMHRWLRRIGYTPVRSSLLVNAGCPQRLTEEIEGHLKIRRHGKHTPVALIGHSRGGILARALAARLQEDASHLIHLGSPAAAVTRAMDYRAATAGAPAGQAVYRAGLRARQLLDPDCDAPDCGCAFLGDVRRPLHSRTRVVSIYSREDPIVPKAASRAPDGRNVEISGSHSGLAYNIAAYEVIAEELARRNE